MVFFWRLRYKLSPRDLAEMFLELGYEFTHEAVRDWEARIAPLHTYPRATRETPGNDMLHRTNRYLNNRLQQDHRDIKQRSYPMRGLKASPQPHASVEPSMKCASSFGSRPP